MCTLYLIRVMDTLSWRRHRVAESVGDREPPVAPERARRDADAWRGLAPLVLGLVDHPDDPLDLVRRQSLADELLGVEVALDVAEQDRVEDVVGGKRLVVALLGAQLGRRRARDHVARHEVASGLLVAPLYEPVDPALVNVLQHREA